MPKLPNQQEISARPAGPADRRRFGRRACRVHGWIRPNRKTRVPCVMTDFSAGGACLVVEPSVRLPFRFQLCFDGLDEQIPCEVRHDTPGKFGVEFACKRRGQEGIVPKLMKWLGHVEPPLK